MTLYSVILSGGIAAEACLLVFAALRLRRSLPRLAFITLFLDYIVMAGVFVGLRSGALGPAWNDIALWTFVLSHPLTALFLLFAVHGEFAMRRYPYLLALLLPVPLFAWFAPPGGYLLSEAYNVAPLNWYLVLCLAVPLGETAAAWHRSTARKSELFLLLIGAIVIVLTGPIYSFELEALGLTEVIGSNPGAPLAAFLFVIALAVANPLQIPRVPPGAPSDPQFPPGRLVVIDEPSPKASARFAHQAARIERPVLEITRTDGDPEPGGVRHFARVTMAPSPRLASIVHGTTSEFLARRPSGIAYIRDLSYVVTLAGARSVREILTSLERTVSGTLGTVVASLADLTAEERLQLLGIPNAQSYRLPDPMAEIEAVLDRSLGGGGRRLLEAFAVSEARNVASISFEDIPALRQFLSATGVELARTSGDAPMMAGWKQVTERVSEELAAFARKGLAELSAEPWPSLERGETIDSFLVRPSDYWKERGLDEALQIAATNAVREGFGDRVRSAFIAALGRSGEKLFEAEIKRLRKSPEELEPEDVRAILENTDAVIDTLEETIDVAAGRADFEARTRKLRSMLLGITEEVGRAA